jgi:hypothetical protein
MNMLIRPIPLPDELDRGYLGRLIRINGLNSEVKAIARIAEHFGTTDLSRREISCLELLALAAGLTVEEFAKLHSTMPLRLAVSDKSNRSPYGSFSAARLHKIGMTALRPEAYFCGNCVAEDISFHGLAYWRRSHQIRGQLWCPKHLTPLRFQSGALAFLTSPAHLQKTAKEVLGKEVEQAIKHDRIKVFLDIAAGLTMSASSASSTMVANDLQRRAVHQGLASSCAALEGSSVMSESVARVFPSFWTSGILPASTYGDSLEKLNRGCLRSVDEALKCNQSSPPVWAYILAAALLFESAEEALNEVFYRSGNCASDPLSFSVSERLHDNEQLVSAYISTKGCYALAAQQLNSTLLDITGKLSRLGLPNLASGMVRQKSRRDALAAFYLGQKSIEEGATVGGISSIELEALLRKTGSLFASALKAMNIITTVQRSVSVCD